MRKVFLWELIISAMFVFDAAFANLFGIPFYILLLIYLGSMAEVLVGTRIYVFIRSRLSKKRA